MALTEEQQLRKDQAIANSNQETVLRLRKLVRDQTALFSEMETIARLIGANPAVLSLTDNDLAEMNQPFDAAKLQASLATLGAIREAVEANGWTAGLLGIY